MTAGRTPSVGNFLTPTAEAGRTADVGTPARQNTIRAGNAGTGNNGTPSHHHHHHHAREVDSGPYRDEDVLLSLQLLAYLSKYPHCRQAFYKPRTSFHPATAQLSNEGRYGQSSSSSRSVAASSSAAISSSSSSRDVHPLVKAFNNATGRGKEKERASSSSSTSTPGSSSASGPNTAANGNGAVPPRMTNVFALVERFTYRHSSSELESPNPPPSLPPEIQYWAGVIMRNACRKDDSRGGIRQCANSASFPLLMTHACTDTACSAVWTVGAVPARVRQVPTLSEGEVLRKRVSEHCVERRPPVLVQREGPGGGWGTSPPRREFALWCEREWCWRKWEHRAGRQGGEERSS